MPETQETPRILLVEDDQFLSMLLKNRLEREGGFQIMLAKSGDEALKLLGEFRPHLMLLDVILPGKTGFEVLEEMQKLPTEKPPVIIISNLGQDIDIEKGRALGVVDYFVKARTSTDEIVEKIKAMFIAGN